MKVLCFGVAIAGHTQEVRRLICEPVPMGEDAEYPPWQSEPPAISTKRQATRVVDRPAILYDSLRGALTAFRLCLYHWEKQVFQWGMVSSRLNALPKRGMQHAYGWMHAQVLVSEMR